jgi:benzoylformate decarboxylase
MQTLIHRYLNQNITRRGLIRKLTATGLTAAAAQSIVQPLDATEEAGKGLPVPGGETKTGTGGELVMAQAKAAGSEYLFTNPGSFEVGLFDAQVTSGVPLIMGLHEGLVVSMADGYHRASLRPAFVNVHVAAGTAQMTGQLYNAARDGSAMVITAGMLDNEVWSDEGILAPRPGFDQKEIPRQFTKFVWEAREPRSLALMLRRAYKVATSAPGGPVYIAMANYALEAKNIAAQILPAERFLAPSRPRPEAIAVEQTAKWIIQARRPLVVVGDEVWKAGAVADLVAFAEKFSLPVASGNAGFRNFPNRHPLHLGGFSMASDYVKGGCDLIVMLGARDFGGRAVPGSPEVPPNARIVRIGLDTLHMGRNYATDLALVADVKESLKDLRASLESMLTAERLETSKKDRDTAVRAESKKMWQEIDGRVKKNSGMSLMHPDELNHIMAKTLEPNSIVVGEVHSGPPHFNIFPWGYREDELGWIGYTSNGLGWGIGAATGAKLGAPDRPVVCSIGDGAVMYSAAGFWTQARYGIPVLTVIWNNLNYQTVRMGFHRYNGNMASTGHYAGMYLGDPDINFVQLAESQGVKGEKANNQTEFEAALKRGIQATKNGNPYVVEAMITRIGGGAESTWHEGFKLTQRMKGTKA